MLLYIIFYHNPNNKNQRNKMFSSRSKSASASASSVTSTMKKEQGEVLSEDYQEQHPQQKMKTGRNKNQTFSSSITMVSDEKQLQQMMKAQKQKDKQELKSYRRKRDTEKRTRNILVLQSRRVKDNQKLCSVKVFDEYEEHNGTFICKHSCCYLGNSNDCKECFYGSTPVYSN